MRNVGKEERDTSLSARYGKDYLQVGLPPRRGPGVPIHASLSASCFSLRTASSATTRPERGV